MKDIRIRNGSFIQTSDHLLEMKTGGGCISLFGLPFFGAGVFMLLITLRVIPLSNGGDQTWWTWLILGGMGIIFSAVGGALVFGRTWHTIDNRQKRIWISQGLLKPLRSSSYDLHLFDAVALRYQKGDSDTADKYPVVLASAQGLPDLVLLNASSYGQAREQAILIGEFLRFEVLDGSIGVDQPLQNPSLPPRQPAPSAMPVLPSQPGFELRENSEELYIGVLGKGISRLRWLFRIIPLLLFLPFGFRFMSILWSPGTPVFVSLFYLGFFGLFFVFLPLLAVLRGMLRSGKPVHELRITKEGLELRDLSPKKMFKLSWEGLYGVDYTSLETTLLSLETSPQRIDPARVPDWLKKLARSTGSRGLVIKAYDGLHHFGMGLSDEELVFLNAVVNEALMKFRPLI